MRIHLEVEKIDIEDELQQAIDFEVRRQVGPMIANMLAKDGQDRIKAEIDRVLGDFKLVRRLSE